MNFISNKPLYLQIKDYYKDLIDKGAIKFNEALPSVRDVGECFNVNFLTVYKAYEQLVKEGYIINISKKGYYVLKKVNKDNSLLIEKIKELTNSGYKLDEIISYCQNLINNLDNQNNKKRGKQNDWNKKSK